MSSPAHELDPSLERAGGLELSIVQEGSARGPFFSSEHTAQPNYKNLIEQASRTDSGATFLITVMQEVGLIETDTAVAEAKQQLLTIDEAIEPLSEKEETDPDEMTDAEVLSLHSLEEEAKHLEERVAHRLQVDNRIYESYDRYQKEYEGKLDRLEMLHDKTSAYEDSALLSSLRQLQQKLPQPRTDTRSGQDIRLAHRISKNAERTARILILEEISRHA